MKERNLVLAFVILSTLAFVAMWFYVSQPTLQVGGAFHGTGSSDHLSPFMASLGAIWLLLVIAVLYMSRHKS